MTQEKQQICDLHALPSKAALGPEPQISNPGSRSNNLVNIGVQEATLDQLDLTCQLKPI